MYYVRWMENLGDRKVPYLVIKNIRNWSTWGSLADAHGFDTRQDALLYISQPGRDHWLQYTKIEFIHPLNYEERKKKDI